MGKEDMKVKTEEDATEASTTASREGHPARGMLHTNYRRVPERKVTTSGKCEALVVNVFDCSSKKQKDQYSTTIKEIVKYIGVTYKYGGDLCYFLENLKEPVMSTPTDLSIEEKKSDTNNYLWKKECAKYFERKKTLDMNNKTCYALVWGH
mmetsp:Transcript_24251/g.71343  ORF Transcript_24251/g.71343 Transcript_24251/m.71343 type:complete len:151 (-) Transcript_24251:593-1045(-)